MKNLILFLFGFLFISIQAKINPNSYNIEEVNVENVFANKFYIIQNDGKVKYVSETDIKKIWEKKLQEEGYNTKLNKFEILTSNNSETGEIIYFLKSISTDEKIETGAFFIKTKLGMLLGTKECTCTGCASGCNLTIFGENCSCSSCGFGGSQECKKTEKQVVKTTSGADFSTK